jgi:hypothetical protein
VGERAVVSHRYLAAHDTIPAVLELLTLTPIQGRLTHPQRTRCALTSQIVPEALNPSRRDGQRTGPTNPRKRDPPHVRNNPTLLDASKGSRIQIDHLPTYPLASLRLACRFRSTLLAFRWLPDSQMRVFTSVAKVAGGLGLVSRRATALLHIYAYI